MSENNAFGFAKLVPGFDFLQNLAKGASQNLPHMPSLSNWVAPTLNVEELDKRIGELKAVHFWLDQNSKALGATIQALEVQKMTLATLQGMNFSMGEVANALKLKPPEKANASASARKASDAADAAAADAARRKSAAPAARKGKDTAGDGGSAQAPVDPMQWWGALTKQFQEIAANAMKDVAQKAAPAAGGKDKGAGAAGDAGKAAKKAAPRKSAARKGSTGQA